MDTAISEPTVKQGGEALAENPEEVHQRQMVNDAHFYVDVENEVKPPRCLLCPKINGLRQPDMAEQTFSVPMRRMSSIECKQALKRIEDMDRAKEILAGVIGSTGESWPTCPMRKRPDQNRESGCQQAKCSFEMDNLMKEMVNVMTKQKRTVEVLIGEVKTLRKLVSQSMKARVQENPNKGDDAVVPSANRGVSVDVGEAGEPDKPSVSLNGVVPPKRFYERGYLARQLQVYYHGHPQEDIEEVIALLESIATMEGIDFHYLCWNAPYFLKGEARDRLVEKTYEAKNWDEVKELWRKQKIVNGYCVNKYE
jgi:hypothetical protein